MDQRLMIAVFVARTELQMAVQEQPDIVLEAREDDVLVTRVASEDDLVGINIVFGRHGDAFGLGETNAQAHSTTTQRIRSGRAGELVGEQERAPQRHPGVDNAEQHRRPHQAEIRNQKNWEKAATLRALRGSQTSGHGRRHHESDIGRE